MNEFWEKEEIKELHGTLTKLIVSHLFCFNNAEKENKPDGFSFARRCATKCLTVIEDHTEKIKGGGDIKELRKLIDELQEHVERLNKFKTETTQDILTIYRILDKANLIDGKQIELNLD